MSTNISPLAAQESSRSIKGESAVSRVMWIGAGLGLFYWSYSVYSSGGSWLGGSVLAFFSLVMFVVSFSKSSVCPACGEDIELEMGEGVNRCSSCESYMITAGDTVRVPEDNYRHDKPVFKTELPEEFAWPNMCTVCSAKATCTKECTLETNQTGRNILLGAAGLAAGALVVRTGGGSTVTLSAPYCEGCTGGMELEAKGDGHLICFSSHGFYLAFQAMNKTESVEQNEEQGVELGVA